MSAFAAVDVIVAKRDRHELSREQIEAELRRSIPLGGTLGDPLYDLAPVLAFLASDDSRFITGQTIAVDGGLMMLGS